ncbi:cytochrome c-type biogenesis protein [Glaciecola sp. 2405UD65-10]|uniref:cytochrome c-type biogenesis protein n=1 Tax=Glaciecola sp. 2405UD65-10 TaxID=3397244 RepID=UPI003B5C0F4D
MSKRLVVWVFSMMCLSGLLGANLANAQETNIEHSEVKQEYAENYVFADPAKRKEFLELTASLRCPKCQNQNIADSNAPISHDMRRKVYELMQQGSSQQEVIEWMKQRYGDFVYYKPPVNAATIWLWLIPVLFVCIMLTFFLRKRNVQTDDNINEKLARAEQLLKDE